MSSIHLDYEIFVMEDLFSDILYLSTWLLGWADIVENESMSISKEFSLVMINIYLVILS